jgi:hypothetical protein
MKNYTSRIAVAASLAISVLPALTHWRLIGVCRRKS